jgi:hypothetical protein
MPMVRKLYPPDWAAIAAEVKELAGYKCEACGKQCRRPEEPFDTHLRTLTTAHLNHRPWDCSGKNLKALCSVCHLRFDAGQNQRLRWFRFRIDGGLGVGGRQLHMFVQGIALGRVIHGQGESVSLTFKEANHGKSTSEGSNESTGTPSTREKRVHDQSRPHL